MSGPAPHLLVRVYDADGEPVEDATTGDSRFRCPRGVLAILREGNREVEVHRADGTSITYRLPPEAT